VLVTKTPAAPPVKVLCSFVSPAGEVLYWTTETPPLDVVASAIPYTRYVLGHRCRPDRAYYYRSAEPADARA
jgi:hypothetical protein